MKLRSKPFKMAVFGAAVAVVFMSFLQTPHHITVWMAGDSTMADKQVKYYPETGWGMPFHWFFDSTVTVKNIAKNGRSTRTFIKEGLWKSIIDNAQPGDYVFIQFGHNDEVPTKASATTPDEYTANLIRFVQDVRSKNATPILLTPVSRRSFDATGKLTDTHQAYSALVVKVAQEQHVTLIDMNKDSQALLQKFGPDNSRLLYNHLAPGENPNYPNGKTDDTHFNELGARLMAQLVLNDIKELHLDLANRIVKSGNQATVNPQAK